MPDEYDVIAEAAGLIEENLSRLQTETETKKFRIQSKSKLACQCASCRVETFSTLIWLQDIRKSNSKPTTAE